LAELAGLAGLGGWRGKWLVKSTGGFGAGGLQRIMWFSGTLKKEIQNRKVERNGRQEIAFLNLMRPSPRRACAGETKGTGAAGRLEGEFRQRIFGAKPVRDRRVPTFLRARGTVERGRKWRKDGRNTAEVEW
jgi:hypothetical protein